MASHRGKERERATEQETEREDSENEDRDRAATATQRLCRSFCQPSGHMTRNTAGVSKNLRHAESQRPIPGSVEQSQVSVYRIWGNGGMG